MRSFTAFKILAWRAFQFMVFYWRAKNRYRIHHDKIYDFCLQILDDQRRFYLFGDVRTWREELSLSREMLEWTDYGAGSQSVYGSGSIRSVRAVYQSSSSPEFKGKWLARLVWWWEAENILELGTCLGVGSSYLAGARKKASYTGIEGSERLSNYTRKALRQVGAYEAQVINGRFEKVLPELLEKEDFDLVFIDGNHTKKATLIYDNMLREKIGGRCLLIFDDIYWNSEMKEAWKQIQQKSGNDLCIDLFFVGLVFINSSMLLKPRQFSLIPFTWKPLPF
ncbi:MAG TPA: class I SAM-dependent methyltransferase [Saprospiraceae bacterium]|nr:class I SAM-dependent methyltransferase [Saprospiraceae bacterium]